MNHLRFTIRNQWIIRIDRFKPVAKSRNYLYAKFDFLTNEWTGIKTALFNCVGLSQPIGQLIDENGICEVPHEVLDFEGDGDFTVSVFCGDLVTVNKATVHVYETGYVDEWGGSQPPTPDVYEQILGRLNSVEQLEVESETLPEGSSATVEKSKNPETGGYIFNFGIPKGEGGEDGYSPTVEVSDIEGGHAITITDKNGSRTFNVIDGTEGHDGYSPVVTVSDITGGHTVTITDKNGDHSFNVMDGQGGSVTVDDELSTTSTNPVQNKVITGELNDVKADLSELPKTEDSTKTGVDLDVSDEDGNVLVRFKDGEIQTKEFDSTQASMTKVSDAIADLDFSDTNGNVILRIRDGNIITKRFNSTGKYYEKVISVKKDGTGDYTTLRGALDSITDASVENPYRIEIYPGTYNVMDDYTQEEIETADVSDYHQGFPGPLITNGVSLVGVGMP